MSGAPVASQYIQHLHQLHAVKTEKLRLRAEAEEQDRRRRASPHIDRRSRQLAGKLGTVAQRLLGAAEAARAKALLDPSHRKGRGR